MQVVGDALAFPAPFPLLFVHLEAPLQENLSQPEAEARATWPVVSFTSGLPPSCSCSGHVKGERNEPQFWRAGAMHVGMLVREGNYCSAAQVGLKYVHMSTSCLQRSEEGPITWNWSHRQLQAILWVLGNELWSCGRSASVLFLYYMRFIK